MISVWVKTIIELFGKPEWSLIEAHQASTHLSIGLLVGAALFDIGAFVVPGKRVAWREVALWIQGLGTLLLLATFALGYFGNPFAGKSSEIAIKADWHFRFGLATLGFFTFVTLWRVLRRVHWRRLESTLYALVFILGIALLSITGWMGGHILD